MATLIVDDSFITLRGGVWITNPNTLWYNFSSSWAAGTNSTNKGSLSYTFQGGVSSIQLRKKISLSNAGTSLAFIGNTPPPLFSQFFLVSIDSGNPFTASYPIPKINSQWYTTPQLSDQQHTVVLSELDNIDLDYVIVGAGLTTPLEGQTVLVDDSSSEISWEGNWTISDMIFTTGSDPAYPCGNGTHISSTVGDSFKFQFAGNSISVYGILPWQTPGNMSVAFSVDDRPAITQTFPTVNPVPGVTTTTNYVFFEEITPSSGNHTLTVNIIEVNGDFSMIVDYLTYIPSFSTLASKPNFTNSSSTDPPASTASSAATSSLPATVSAQNRSDHSKAIVGGTIGGVACLVLIAMAIWVLGARRKKQEPSAITIEAFDCHVSPPTPACTSSSPVLYDFSTRRPRIRSTQQSPPSLSNSSEPSSLGNIQNLTVAERQCVLRRRVDEIQAQLVLAAENTGAAVSPAVAGDEMRERIDMLTRENERLMSYLSPPPSYAGMDP